MCRGYLGVVIQERQPGSLAQSIDAACLSCGYKIDWKLVRGKSPAK